MAEPNVFAEVWERDVAHRPLGIRGTRLGTAEGAERLGVSVSELEPGKRNLPYHAHFRDRGALDRAQRATDAAPRTASGCRPRARWSPSPPGATARTSSSMRRRRGALRHRQHEGVGRPHRIPRQQQDRREGGSFPAPGSVSYMVSTEDQLSYFDGEAGEEPTR